MPQKGGYLDATSSFMPQKGGYLNGTKNKDIQQLISMLSATSDDNYTANSTDNTEQLKDKLFNIIQSGGTDGDSSIVVFRKTAPSEEMLLKVRNVSQSQKCYR